ncbi:MAG: hypothetical protein E6K06_05800 [Methanobacteriota archaeon]|nr:MAG: hypothetical protein E6K09_01430 [Euryarchaeota archaeon]TLZ71591.1 MAG: hypothetical protein E6K06_05800 [Euryarchaeota archaeon]
MALGGSRTLLIAVLASSGTALVVLGMILYTFGLFPEIKQDGDFVLISQSLWTLPSLVIGLVLLGGATLFAIRRPRKTRLGS